MKVLVAAAFALISSSREARAQETAIVPSPTEPALPAYQLHAETDLPVLGIGAVFLAARLTRTEKAFCAPLCNPDDLNALDRTTAGNYNRDWSTATDIGIYALLGGAVTTLVVDEGFSNALNDSVVIGESAVTGLAVSSILTLATNRPRPFLYGEKAPLSERNSPNGSLSYSSSHATLAFALATSTFVTMKRLHPRSNEVLWVAGIGGAMAAFVATGRVFAGMHFITDAVSGAVVGTSVGVLVPALHGSPVRIVPLVGEGGRGIGVIGSF